MHLEILKKLKLFLTDAASSFQLLTVKMNLRVMFFLLVLVGEVFFTQFTFKLGGTFLFDSKMDTLVMLSEIFGLRKVFVASFT